MPTADSLRLPRAPALRLALPDGREITVPPPSLQQAAACLRLDPTRDAPEESQRERVNRMLRQAEILLGPAHAALAGELTIDQVAQVVQALYLAGCGFNPTAFVELQKIRQQKRHAEDVLAEIDRLTMDLAADLKQLPSTVEQMPVADAVNLQKRLADNARAAAKFDAALHGATL